MELHELSLLDYLSSRPSETLDQNVYRVTGLTREPIAFSSNGGRWAPREPRPVPVLYTSLDADGALAEVVSYLMMLTPLPSKPLLRSTLRITTSNTIRIARVDFSDIELDEARYNERNYDRTQRIGAALNYLGFDGLIAPSARWDCDNLIVFEDNHALDEKLEIVENREIPDWQDWAKEHSLVSGS